MSAELIEDGIRVTLECIGEGWSGDYNESDPSDEYLMRFDVYIKHPEPFNYPYPDNWYPLDDTSYCTRFPESASQELQDKAVRFIMDKIKDIVLNNRNDIFESILGGDYTNGGIKKLCEHLSWIAPSWVADPPDAESLNI
jgi:hypothetical protein